MRTLNDDEISQVLDEVDKLPDFGAYPVYESVEYAAKAQFKRDLKDFIELLENIDRDHGDDHTCYELDAVLESLKQLVE
jgi:hypothetical protein